MFGIWQKWDLLVHSCFIFFSIQDSKGENENLDICFPSCPGSWEKKEEHCILWPHPILSWTKDEEFCIDKDAHLASVLNLEIHNYIRSKVNVNDYETFFWIGETGQKEEGNWMWTDGSSWNFTKWATSLNQQPNDFHGREDCLQIYSSWTIDGWNDQSCESKGKLCMQWQNLPICNSS